MLISEENYIYKKEVDWSLLMEGLTLPIENQVVFGQIMGRFLSRGESKPVHLYLDGKSYDAKINNIDFDQRFNRKTDTLQIRYKRNGELSQKLQQMFSDSFAYISYAREHRPEGDRSVIRLPEDRREYLALYTTAYDDTYLLEPITHADMLAMRSAVRGWPEQVLETMFNYEVPTADAGLFDLERITKVSKLNRKIGDNLKLLYGYRCQICGRLIGEEYGSSAAEAHHISYYTESLNSDADNQLILCPNHHSLIHRAVPTFDRKKKLFLYDNGYQEHLVLNQHI